MTISNGLRRLFRRRDNAARGLAIPAPPRRVFHVGVTGHRTNRLNSADLPALRTTVREVLGAVAESVAACGPRSLALGYGEADPRFRVVCAIAAGSDQLVADEALKMGYELQCVLPFAAQEYELDFDDPQKRASYNRLLKTATGVLEMDGLPDERPAAYERAGRVMLWHCDVLIAIWNGEEGNGRGGTSETVKEAISRGIPVVWIHSNSPRKYQLLGPDAGPHPRADLKERVGRIVAPAIDDDPKLRSAYFTGSFRRQCQGRIFSAFRKTLLIGTKSKPNVRQDAAETAFTGADQFDSATIPDCFDADYRRADNLAGHFGGLYRNSFVANYLIAAAAVATALIEGHTLTTLIELFLLGYIVWKIGAGRRNCWHERWLSFRILAEELRQASILYPLGRTLRPFRVPAHGEGADPNRLWVSWLARAKMREAGIVTSALDSESVERYRRSLVSHLAGQREYHSTNHSRNAVMAHRIHRIGLGLFLAAIVAVVVHLLIELGTDYPNTVATWPEVRVFLLERGPAMSRVTTILDALLPTIGAAFAGIGSQGEFGRISERSRAMEHHLGSLIARAQKAAPTSDACGQIAEEASDIMTAELMDWHVIFLEKGIEVPV